MKFSKVGTTDYYRQFDGLEGHELIDGEMIEVKFPDGSIYGTAVLQEKGRGSEQIDMNNFPDRFPTSQAYILYVVKGAHTKIYLRNSELLVRRVRSPIEGSEAGFWHDGERYHYS